MADRSLWDGDIPWVTPKDMKQFLVGDSVIRVSEKALTVASLRLLPAGVVLMVVRGMILARRVPIALTKCSVTINQDMKAILPTEGIDSRYLAYRLAAAQAELAEFIDESGHGTKRLPTERWRELPLAIPTLLEQQRIVKVLNWHGKNASNLVRAKKELILRLNEYKRTAINRAVMRGLNAAAPLKKSDIAWLGDVPAHWSILKLKQIATLRSGEAITSAEIEPSGSNPVYGGNGLRGYTDEHTHEGEFVLIGRQGALCGNIHYASGRFFASEHAVVVNPRHDVSIRWLGETLRTMNLNQYSLAAAQPGLAVERIEQLSVAMPPMIEQREIGEFCTKIGDVADAAISAIRREISLLDEYRLRFNKDVVTGKLDVRSEALVLEGDNVLFNMEVIESLCEDDVYDESDPEVAA